MIPCMMYVRTHTHKYLASYSDPGSILAPLVRENAPPLSILQEEGGMREGEKKQCGRVHTSRNKNTLNLSSFAYQYILFYSHDRYARVS